MFTATSDSGKVTPGINRNGTRPISVWLSITFHGSPNLGFPWISRSVDWQQFNEMRLASAWTADVWSVRCLSTFDTLHGVLRAGAGIAAYARVRDLAARRSLRALRHLLPLVGAGPRATPRCRMSSRPHFPTVGQ